MRDENNINLVKKIFKNYKLFKLPFY